MREYGRVDVTALERFRINGYRSDTVLYQIKRPVAARMVTRHAMI